MSVHCESCFPIAAPDVRPDACRELYAAKFANVSVSTKLKNVSKELYEMFYTTTTKFKSADVFIKILNKFIGFYLHVLS